MRKYFIKLQVAALLMQFILGVTHTITFYLGCTKCLHLGEILIIGKFDRRKFFVEKLTFP